MTEKPQGAEVAPEDEKWMNLALEQADKAAALGEIPVGAVIVCNGRPVASAFNERESKKSALAHAECTAIARACETLGGWRLWQCELYVTMEPCPMCAGAIINSRLKRVVYGASDPKAGCCGSVTNLFELPFNHRPQVVGGVCGQACSERLTNFFARLRREHKDEPVLRQQKNKGDEE